MTGAGYSSQDWKGSSRHRLLQSSVKAAISLLLRALECAETDGNLTVELVGEASDLLSRRYSRERAEEATTLPRQVSGGLAAWQSTYVIAYIESRISKSLPLSDLARVAKLSENYFSAAVRTCFGQSPHRYIVACRIERAKRKMLDTEAPLSEIALDCGLADQAHFSRVFRQLKGTTPSIWRKANRAVQPAYSARTGERVTSGLTISPMKSYLGLLPLEDVDLHLKPA